MVTKENFEEYALLYVDKELTNAEEKALLAFVELHPELKSELHAYTTTTLLPDSGIVYTDKEALLKDTPKTAVISLSRYKIFYAAAASIIALLFVLFLNNNNTETTTIAQNNTEQNTTTFSKPINATPEEEKQTTTKAIVANTAPVPQTHQQKEQVAQNTESLPSAKKRVIETAPTQLEVVSANHISFEEASIAALDVKPMQTTSSYKPTIVEETPGYFTDNITPLFALSESATGLSELSKVVTNKINNVKNTAGQLKGSDVKLKIGKKEILIVTL